MSKNDSRLLQFCRYYNGESECPFRDNDKKMFWFYEQNWISQNNMEGAGLLCDYVDVYSRAGLSQFQCDDDAPVSLKALLFDRYCKWYSSLSLEESAEGFKKFYLNEYMKKK